MPKHYRYYSGELSHSSGVWKNHKYLKKIGNKYIYPIKKSLETRKNLKEAQQNLNNRRVGNAISTNPNYQLEYAARVRRDELQRQYDRTVLGRAEKGFRGVARRLSQLGPKQAHRFSVTSVPANAHVVDLKDIDKKLKDKKNRRNKRK